MKLAYIYMDTHGLKKTWKHLMRMHMHGRKMKTRKEKRVPSLPTPNYSPYLPPPLHSQPIPSHPITPPPLRSHYPSTDHYHHVNKVHPAMLHEKVQELDRILIDQAILEMRLEDAAFPAREEDFYLLNRVARGGAGGMGASANRYGSRGTAAQAAEGEAGGAVWRAMGDDGAVFEREEKSAIRKRFFGALPEEYVTASGK